MHDLVPFNDPTRMSRIERQTGLALEEVYSRQRILTAREVGRVELVTEVAEAALIGMSHISALESLLANRNPLAAERLRHIADAAALSFTEIVIKAGRRW